LNSLEDKSERQRLQGFYSILVLLKENLQAGSSATKQNDFALPASKKGRFVYRF